MAIRIQGTEVINDNREIVNSSNFPGTVDKPIPLSPADGETDIGENPVLDGGSYHSAYDIPHAISRFQIADDDQFSNIVYDTGEIAATETFSMPTEVLIESTTYYWRVYYIDDEGVSSGFSDTFQFTTSDDLLPIIGTPYGGGFFAGIIDTIAGTINSQDDYQTGERYALVVSPKSLERNTGLAWDSQDRAGEAGSFTRWDGLSSTENILTKNDSDYEIFEHIRSIRSSDPVPSDGGSDWYLPAMDELELIYRNLKPTTNDNNTGDQTRNFPGVQDNGFNPSSDPNGSAYTESDPSQTSVTDFQNGGAEAVDLTRYHSSTDADEADRAWEQSFNRGGQYGDQNGGAKDFTGRSARPVRRLPLN